MCWSVSPTNRETVNYNFTSTGSWETDRLTPRQFEVLELLGHGLYQKEIAERLFISPQTVKTHVKHIYEKLSVSDRRSAVERGRALHLLSRQ